MRSAGERSRSGTRSVDEAALIEASGCAQVVRDRRQEPRSCASDLRVDARVAGFALEPETVDGGGEPGDEGLEQRPVGARQRVLAARRPLPPRAARCARSSWRRPFPVPRPSSSRTAARTVQRTSRNRATSASAAPATTASGSSPAISRVVRSRRMCVSRSRCSALRRAASSRDTVHPRTADAAANTTSAARSSSFCTSKLPVGEVK